MQSLNYRSFLFTCVKYLLCSFILLIQSKTNGQNYLINDQHSSFHTGVQISYNSFENYYAVLPGYTFDGRLTLGFDLGENKRFIK